MTLNEIKPEKISLKTKDNYILKANFYNKPKQKKCVLLLHQYSKNKESWNELIPRLISNKHAVLALDLRGHGESTGNYKNFEEKDFENMELDVKTAMKFLEEQKFEKNDISLIGSSIGANLAQNYAASNPNNKTILLSPGFNYKGIVLIIKDTKALIIVSKEDEYSYKTVKDIEKKCPFTECIYLENKGHGIYMLDKELISSINLFLNE
ncbi:alpha/beta hydrolase [Candidatus Woesearchaeota archaeon]|nr:alpha/beta hydrolase [Candidatus Woesearchaeota archaeon]